MNQHRRDSIFLPYTSIICPKSRSYMYDTSTIFSSYKVTRNHSKGFFWIFSRKEPRNQLLIGSTHKVSTLTFGHDLVRYLLAIFIIGISHKISLLGGFKEFSSKLFGHQCFCQYHLYRFECILVKGFHQYIINIFTYCQGCIGRQSPRSGRPS